MKIVLIGYMGAGKSFLAESIHKELGLELGDMDSKIVEKTDCSSISEIFNRYGENYFRKLESEIAKDFEKKDNIVISTGGGVVTSEKNMKYLCKNSFIIWVDADTKILFNRVSGIDRPLALDYERFSKRYNTRFHLYHKYSQFYVDTSGSKENTLNKIFKQISCFNKPKKIFVIGDPVAQSKSPEMHHAGYKYLGINKQYEFQKKQVQKSDLKRFLTDLPSCTTGLAVTIPHKVSIQSELTEQSDISTMIGAVNTVTIEENGSLVGTNTDYFGVIHPLRLRIGELSGDAVIFGSGGAARAAVYGFLTHGVNVTLLVRNINTAQTIVNEVHQFQKESKIPKNRTISIDVIANAMKYRSTKIIFQATPLGMRPLVGKSVVSSEFFGAHQIVFDAVYTPLETQFLINAKSKGAVIIHGYEMLLWQGVLQFEIFTGKSAPVEAMKKGLLDALHRN